MSLPKKPARIPTGVRNTTVVNPMHLSQIGQYYRGVQIDTRQGDPAKLDFKAQTKNYEGLRKALQRNGQDFDWIGIASYEGEAGYQQRWDNPNAKARLTRFVCTSPNLIWEKYEGYAAGGGQNYVYVGGKKIKVSQFLAMLPSQQDALLSGKVAAPKYHYLVKVDIKAIDKELDIAKLKQLTKKFATLSKAVDYNMRRPWVDFVATFFYKTEEARNIAREEAEKVFGDHTYTKSKRVIK